MQPQPGEWLVHAASISKVQAAVRETPSPDGKQQRREVSTLRSLAYGPAFTALFAQDGEVGIAWGADPPDFFTTDATGRASVEVTQITVPRSEIFNRERGAGPFTSALRAGKPSREFWEEIRSGTLPDDSWVKPHFEPVAALDADFFAAARIVFEQKLADLPRYQADYQRRILLVEDRLTGFKTEFERRAAALAALFAGAGFDAVLVVDGNHHAGAVGLRF